MNIVISHKGVDEIAHFLTDAIITKGTHPDGWNFISPAGKRYGLKTYHWDWKFTPDTATFTEGVGWNKKPSEMATAKGTEIAKPTDQEYIAALDRLMDLANKSFAQVDAYIETTVTDLSSAKTVLKMMAKVELALIKILAHGRRL